MHMFTAMSVNQGGVPTVLLFSEDLLLIDAFWKKGSHFSSAMQSLRHGDSLNIHAHSIDSASFKEKYIMW